MKVAVIGLGRMGERHVKIIKNLGMEIVGLFDSNINNVKKVITDNELKYNKEYKNILELYETDTPDAVVVSSTAPSHCKYVCEAAKANVKYILCEKPMAVSIEEAQLMRKVCKEKGSKLAINHQMRFMTHYQDIKKLALSEDFGGTVSVILSGSNCGLSMNGSHYFEFLRYLTGENVKNVSAWLENEIVKNPRGISFEDRGGIIKATTPKGISMHMDISVKSGHGLNLIIICRYGQIFVDEIDGFVRIISRNKEYRDLPTSQYACKGTTKSFYTQPSEVYESTKSVWNSLIKGRNYPDSEVGIHCLLCLVAAYTSNKHGNKPISLNNTNIDFKFKYPWA